MDNDNVDGDGDDRREGDCNHPSPPAPKDRASFFLSNNFENYRRMKMGQPERKGGLDAEHGRGEQWNHFTAPLDPTREPTRPQLVQWDARKTRSSPPLFSDLERSQAADRFGRIIAEYVGNAISSGKLTRAWKNSGDDGGGSGGVSFLSWMWTDYSPEAIGKASIRRKINPKDYAAERKMIHPHLTPIVWGSSCMIITLFSLRLGKWYQGRFVARTTSGYAKKTSHASGSGQKSTNSVKSLQDVRRAQHQTNKNPFNPRKEKCNNILSNLNSLPVDLAISMLVGISTTVFLTHPQYLMKDMSRAPLLEGRSALAEELCLPFRKEVESVNEMLYAYTAPYDSGANSDPGDDAVPAQRRQVILYSDLWKDENLGDFDSLRAVRDFVANCHEREKFVRRLLAEDCLDEMSEQEFLEVEIPPPGILTDSVVDENDNVAVTQYDK